MEGETADDSALRADGRSFSYWAVESQSFLTREAEHHFRQHETAYAAWEVSKSQFLFGVKRNDFHDQYLALEDAAETSFAATSSTTSAGGGNKKGRKEINLNQLDRKHQQKFTGDDGSDEREWKAWLSKEACEVLSVGESDRIRAEKKDLIITTRWVRTNKADGLIGKEFQAKSRLVVQGFKDIKNAYFSGKSVDREIYLSQPRGGLPGLDSRQLLYEFAKQFMDVAFARSSQALEFATNHYKEFIFRGREVKQTEEGHVDVSMRNYALSMSNVKIDRARRKQLSSPLTEETKLLDSSAGELGWVARQLRCDLAYENGVIQRCKREACMADLVKLRQYVGQARRAADFRMRYWADVNLQDSVIVHLADSGHANGTPESNEQMRYKSVGGCFILAANKEIMQGQAARCNILAFQSSQTKRVCRSTLAAEASHLAEAVEAGDWICILLEEALTGSLDLRNWQETIHRRQRVYVTDAKSVYDYLQREATSTSTDKRMAIEGALLRETEHVPDSWAVVRDVCDRLVSEFAWARLQGWYQAYQKEGLHYHEEPNCTTFNKWVSLVTRKYQDNSDVEDCHMIPQWCYASKVDKVLPMTSHLEEDIRHMDKRLQFLNLPKKNHHSHFVKKMNVSCGCLSPANLEAVQTHFLEDFVHLRSVLGPSQFEPKAAAQPNFAVKRSVCASFRRSGKQVKLSR
ncbi:unnamed protein product [Effrenium voratum]|nr:unnamed protein product [Effrenium voratum]